jgi:hypothetical protein
VQRLDLGQDIGEHHWVVLDRHRQMIK